MYENQEEQYKAGIKVMDSTVERGRVGVRGRKKTKFERKACTTTERAKENNEAKKLKCGGENK